MKEKSASFLGINYLKLSTSTNQNRILHPSFMIYKHSYILLFFFFSLFVVTSLKARPTDTTVYSVVEKPAKYIFGEAELLKAIRNNIDFNSNPGLITMKGRLKVTYIVEKDGCASHISTFPTGYEKEMTRLFDSFVGWYPAEDKGKIVRSINVIALYFNLH